MRILITTDCVGGVWTYTVELTRELAAVGHEVVVAVMGADLADDQREALEASGVAAWAARPYRLEWMPEPESDLQEAAAWLLTLARQHAVDIVHLNQFAHAALAWPCPAVVVAHSDVVTWWRAVHGCDPGREWAGYRRCVAAGLRAADLVVAPTAAYLAQLRSAYDFSTPTAVIHNGRGAAPSTAAKEPVLLAAGRIWDAAKNIDVAVRAADRVSWPLLVAGPAGDDAAGETTAEFLGRLPGAAVADLLSRAAIFVAPARYEPFGLAALEAGLAGCALVLGDVPTLREVWRDAAMFVAPDDVDGLASALQRLIDDPHLLRERQDAAAKQAATYRPQPAAARYAEQYRRLTSSAERVAS